MQNKLHTTPCHPVPVAIGTVETSHSLIIPLTHFQIFKLVNYRILFLILFPLWGLGGYAQTFNWDWAVSGGGATGGTQGEHIYDIKVGTDNNYYFIATLYGNSAHQLDGQSLPTYNVPGGAAQDILLFSTTCDGTIRWSHVLGGGSTDRAYNLVLDSQDNVYIGGNFNPNNNSSYPVHFSPTDTLPSTGDNTTASDYFKQVFLIKFSSTGQYLGKKALQGDVGYYSGNSNYSSAVFDLAMSNDTLHFIVALQYGLHLDDNVTVPSQYTFDPTIGNNFQYHLAKYDTSLNYVSSMVLPVSDHSLIQPETTRFAYDENLNRYYLESIRSGSNIQVTYDGSSAVNQSFLLAIDGSDGSLLWHREIYAEPVNNNPLAGIMMNSLKIDTNSEVYIGGMIFQSTHAQNPIKIYDPNDSINTTYAFIPTVDTNMPTIVKFNSSGTVQWVKTPTAFAPNYTSNKGGIRPKGLAIKNNEVALGSAEGYFIWDSFTQNYPQFHGVAPTLLRFDKQTGTTVGMHWIDNAGDQGMTAVAVDKDGNYITGGFFYGGTLFPNTPGITPLNSAGESDFFVAKLAAYACGTNSTQKFNTLKINVYPNPTTDIVNIDTDEQLSNYIIYDVSGRQIQSNLFAGSNQINLQNVTTGVYFIKVTTMQGNSGTVKVVKK